MKVSYRFRLQLRFQCIKEQFVVLFFLEYAAEMGTLKEKERQILMRKRRAVLSLHEMREEMRKKKEAIELTENQLVQLQNRLVDKEYELRVLQGELNNQALSGKRAKILTNKILRGITFSGPQEKAVVSLDIKLKATRRKFEVLICIKL